MQPQTSSAVDAVTRGLTVGLVEARDLASGTSSRSSKLVHGGIRYLEQLDFKQSDDRYETQRQAQPQQNPQRREDLQVMNRLQELARRQQDLNEKLKELQTALQEARTEKERQEIQRQLKRLQEDEQQLLADVDRFDPETFSNGPKT